MSGAGGSRTAGSPASADAGRAGAGIGDPVRPLCVLHHLHLSSPQWGGVETQFANFIHATADDPRLENYLAYDMRRAAPQVEALRPALAAPIFDPRLWRGITVPKRLRAGREARQAHRWGCDVVLNTNVFANLRSLRVAAGAGRPAVYWERGAAWYARPEPPHPDFRTGHAMFIVNSKASGRVLRDVWGIAGPFEVLSPCIWTPPGKSPPPARAFPRGRPVRLGFAARLRAFKGGVIALHVLKALEGRGLDAGLDVAGGGPDEARMRDLAARLGLGHRVRFLGQVADMGGFYAGIDLLLHPALREPYGNVCAEAIAAGVPVVATRVDGLPEVVEEGAAGLCVTPDRPLAAFAAMGGDVGDVYPLVYRPERDAVAEPGVPDPAALAGAVLSILGSPATYERYSRTCVALAPARYAPARHVDGFVALMRRAAGM